MSAAEARAEAQELINKILLLDWGILCRPLCYSGVKIAGQSTLGSGIRHG